MGEETVQEVEYLATTRLGEKGQLTIPKEYRDSLGLEPGAPIAVVRVGTGLMLFAEQARFKELCDRIAGALSEHGVSDADLLGTLPEIRDRVYASLYPELVEAADVAKPRRGRSRK
jgi:AbrB family looped-hinge helix DNA binding protein